MNSGSDISSTITPILHYTKNPFLYYSDITDENIINDVPTLLQQLDLII